MVGFEEAKAFLQKDEGGQNLFDHLTEVLLKVVTERPADAVAAFEQLSAGVKNERHSADAEAARAAEPALDDVARAQLAKRVAQLHRDDVEEGQDVDPLPAARAQALADLEQDCAAWRAAGVEISQDDLMKLQLSLARLAGADESIEAIRVWGKLLGRKSDYWVAEGTGGAALDEDAEDAEAPEPEANGKTYWVSVSASGPWTQLPGVTPSAVSGARQLRRFLTGDLDAPVPGYPAFPGTERALVRATIALINADCALAPKGFFAAPDADEDSGPAGGPEPAEEFAMPSAAELADPAAWEAFAPSFSALGRVRPVESEDAEGNVTRAPEGYEYEALREAAGESWTAWAAPRALAELKSARAVLRSRAWPGAVAVASPATGAWTNVYVGFGAPQADAAYTPAMPPPLQREFDDGAAPLTEQKDVVEDPTPPEEAPKEDAEEEE